MQRLICKPSAFSRAAATYNESACVQRKLASALLERILSLPTPLQAGAVLEVGCGTGATAREIVRRLAPQQLIVNDIAEGMLAKTLAELADCGAQILGLPGDAETIDWPENLDAVISCSVVQWFKNPLGVLDRAYCALHDGGTVAVSTFLPGTLAQVSDFTGCGLSYPDENAWRLALINGFEIEHFSVSEHRMCFDTPRAVLRHLQMTGATGSATHFRWSTNLLADFDTYYRNAHSAPEGGVVLTYRALQFIARKQGGSHDA